MVKQIPCWSWFRMISDAFFDRITIRPPYWQELLAAAVAKEQGWPALQFRGQNYGCLFSNDFYHKAQYIIFHLWSKIRALTSSITLASRHIAGWFCMWWGFACWMHNYRIVINSQVIFVSASMAQHTNTNVSLFFFNGDVSAQCSLVLLEPCRTVTDVRESSSTQSFPIAGCGFPEAQTHFSHQHRNPCPYFSKCQISFVLRPLVMTSLWINYSVARLTSCLWILCPNVLLEFSLFYFKALNLWCWKSLSLPILGSLLLLCCFWAISVRDPQLTETAAWGSWLQEILGQQIFLKHPSGEQPDV